MRTPQSAWIIPLAAALLLASPALGKSGSGSDGTPDDKIEDEIQDDIEKEIERRLEGKIDEKIEERAEKKARDKAKDRAEEKIREKSERKVREDEKRIRDRNKFEKEIEKRTRSEDGEESRTRERVKEKEKSESRTDRSSGGKSGGQSKGSATKISSSAYVGSYAGVMDKAAIESARDSAKTTFELVKAAADAGRDTARDLARAERDAAMAVPGADKAAIDAAYKEAVKAADLQRDISIDEAKESYEATLDQLDLIEDGYEGESSDDVIASAERVFAATRDANGDEIARDEWLLLTTPEDVDAIVRRGFAVKSIEVMKGLGVVMARLEAPESFSLPETSRVVRAETPDARVDYNHLYFPESAPGDDQETQTGDAPSVLMPLGDTARGAGVRIGVIDTEIDRSHAAFRSARLIERSFVPYENARPADHGTAVASIIAGDDAGFSGLAPKAEIYAASVFFQSESGKASATTESLVRALDWMSESGTPIVSMSLAGPPNAILEEAIKRAAKRGVTVVAAAGNEGPMARPMYPAAYEDAVAVTAVTRDKKAYRLANRGDYVDLAAPGVAVLHAKSGGGYSSSSGTSMAAPFVAVALGELRRGGARSAEEALQRVMENAEDLGAPGRDPVFGAGLVRPATN